MHTIEASILIPMGLGLISVLLMLTFYLHDETVLTAEYSLFMLEWQTDPDGMSDEECDQKAAGWSNGLLITRVQPVKLEAGSNLCRIQVRENYRLFAGALTLMEQKLSEERQSEIKISAKVNPCRIKRTWKVIESE